MVNASLSREVRHRSAVLRHVEEVTGNIAIDVPLLQHQSPALLRLATSLDAEGVAGSNHGRVVLARPRAKLVQEPAACAIRSALDTVNRTGV
jgi:hypothetical protein